MCASTESAGAYFAPGCLHGMFGGGYRTGLGVGTACLGILLPFFSLSGFASVCAVVSARCVLPVFGVTSTAFGRPTSLLNALLCCYRLQRLLTSLDTSLDGRRA